MSEEGRSPPSSQCSQALLAGQGAGSFPTLCGFSGPCLFLNVHCHRAKINSACLRFVDAEDDKCLMGSIFQSSQTLSHHSSEQIREAEWKMSISVDSEQYLDSSASTKPIYLGYHSPFQYKQPSPGRTSDIIVLSLLLCSVSSVWYLITVILL